MIVEEKHIRTNMFDQEGDVLYGFYASRNIQAQDISEAKEKAIDKVQKQLEEIGLIINESVEAILRIDEINEVSYVPMEDPSDEGFTWYPED